MYHVYNRGVEKRIIFLDERDYAVFLSFLKHALLPPDSEDTFESSLISDAQRFNLRRQNLAQDVDLVAFCLMPNHFHLLLFQRTKDGITRLMRSVATGYSMYFNKRYERVGGLFQGRYKASHIASDAYWQHISRYIHLNALDLGKNFRDYPYSSYRFYSEQTQADWVKPDSITSAFANAKEYEQFLETYIPHRKELLDVKDLLANT
jgi:putative transposase